MSVDQLAAEAAHGHLRWTDEEMTEIIKSAIEKATEEKQKILDKYTTAMDAIYNHNDSARSAVIQHFGTIHVPNALRQSRAAHAQDEEQQ